MTEEEVKMENVVFSNYTNFEPTYNYRVSIKEYLGQKDLPEGEKIFITENSMLDYNEDVNNAHCFDSDMLDYTTPPNIMEIFPHFPREYYPILDDFRDKGKKKFFNDLKVIRKQEKKEKRKRKKDRGKFTVERKNTVIKFD